MNEEEISLFATRLEHLQSLTGLRTLGLSRMKTANTSGIQDYHFDWSSYL
jgi:hypothetical protein